MNFRIIFIDRELLKDFEILEEFGGLDGHGFRRAKYKWPN